MNLSNKLPNWGLPVTVVVLLVVVLTIGARFVNKSSDAPGPPMAVHAGMYNFRAELANHAARSKEASNPPASPANQTNP